MSKLSYLGKRSESHENARARGSSAPRGFAARSRVLMRLVSLAQIGELARRLCYSLLVGRHLLLHCLPCVCCHNILSFNALGYKSADHHTIWQLGDPTASSKRQNHYRIRRLVFFKTFVFIQPFNIFHRYICKRRQQSIGMKPFKHKVRTYTLQRHPTRI